jgi:hypothetical protein
MPVLPIVSLALTILFAIFAVLEHSLVRGFMAAAIGCNTFVQSQVARKLKQREIESLNL